MHTQHGGTLLGLIIGLVIGLGIALAVAVYVTKVPVPFVNKGQSRSVEQDAAEARKIGMVSRVVAGQALDDTAHELARSIRENAEYGVMMTKKGLRVALDAPSLRHAMELENRTQVLGYFTGAMSAMRDAFAKGETPDWPKL